MNTCKKNMKHIDYFSYKGYIISVDKHSTNESADKNILRRDHYVELKTISTTKKRNGHCV